MSDTKKPTKHEIKELLRKIEHKHFELCSERKKRLQEIEKRQERLMKAIMEGRRDIVELELEEIDRTDVEYSEITERFKANLDAAERLTGMLKKIKFAEACAILKLCRIVIMVIDLLIKIHFHVGDVLDVLFDAYASSTGVCLTIA